MKEFFYNLRFAWIYSKDQKIKLIFYVLFNLIAISISIFVPILSAKIIIELTSSDYAQLIYISLVILFVEVLRNIINYFTKYFSQIIYREGFSKLQIALGFEIVKLENKSIDDNGSGVFIQRLTNDTSRIADIFNVLNIYLSNIVTNLGIFVAIFVINKIAFLYVFIMVLVLFFIDKSRVKKVNEADVVFRQKNEKISGFIGEIVRGVRDIKMLNAEKSFMKELNTKILDLNKHRYGMQAIDRNYTFVRGTLHDIFDTGLIFLLVFLLINDNVAVASALIIYNYTGRVTSIISYIGIFMEKTKDFNLSTSRILSIFKDDNFPKEKFGNKHLKKVNGNFEFKDVSFSYDDNKKVLEKISFKVNANETVAFVGRSGAGKSTIFNLLCKMYDVKEGHITIDGVDIKELDKDTIRGNITIINQSPYIFNLSIRDNLRLVKEDLSEKEMINACKLACLHDFIMSTPLGYDTIVGEGGINLSGGQRQRLAIARAFVQKTEIILFDEATSALDNETQASIKKAIDNLKKSYTILIVAHRLSTVVNSDRILFLNNGKIEAEGKHEDLLNSCDSYRKLYEAELKENE